MSKAFIQKPAPAFNAKAVHPNGEFVDIKLSDYKGTLLNINGNYVHLFGLSWYKYLICRILYRKIFGSLLLSARLVSVKLFSLNLSMFIYPVQFLFLYFNTNLTCCICLCPSSPNLCIFNILSFKMQVFQEFLKLIYARVSSSD